MSTDEILTTMRTVDWRWAAGAAGVVLILILGARLLRRVGRAGAATAVTGLATVLGLAWSAQGMWDTAVHNYQQTALVASVLFIVFESMMAARMLRAQQYRTDYARRGRHVRAVWVIAVIMAMVVALGEGWHQAPGRLAIPLLVAYGWYTDLTADDDPKLKPKTSIRWTVRRLALYVGAIEPGERDEVTVDRDRQVARMTRLGHAIRDGGPTVTDLLRRRRRLARLELTAAPDVIAEVRANLARVGAVLSPEPAPEPAPEPKPDPEPEPIPEPIPEPTPPAPRPRPARSAPTGGRLPQGVHVRLGHAMRGTPLEDDAVRLMKASITPDKPRGMTTLALMALYEPPLGIRNAEKFAAKARKEINGVRPEGISVP